MIGHTHVPQSGKLTNDLSFVNPHAAKIPYNENMLIHTQCDAPVFSPPYEVGRGLGGGDEMEKQPGGEVSSRRDSATSHPSAAGASRVPTGKNNVNGGGSWKVFQFFCLSPQDSVLFLQRVLQRQCFSPLLQKTARVAPRSQHRQFLTRAIEPVHLHLASV
jgi:hypothetical protein